MPVERCEHSSIPSPDQLKELTGRAIELSERMKELDNMMTETEKNTFYPKLSNFRSFLTEVAGLPNRLDRARAELENFRRAREVICR